MFYVYALSKWCQCDFYLLRTQQYSLLSVFASTCLNLQPIRKHLCPLRDQSVERWAAIGRHEQMRLLNSGRGVKTTSKILKIAVKVCSDWTRSEFSPCFIRTNCWSVSLQTANAPTVQMLAVTTYQCTRCVCEQSVPLYRICVLQLWLGLISKLSSCFCYFPPDFFFSSTCCLCMFMKWRTIARDKHTFFAQVSAFSTCADSFFLFLFFFASIYAALSEPVSTSTLNLYAITPPLIFALHSVWTHLKSVQFTFVHIFVFWSACVHCCQWPWLYH